MSTNLETSHVDPFARLRAQTPGSAQFAYPVASGAATLMASSMHTNGPMGTTVASDRIGSLETTAAGTKTSSTTTTTMFLTNFAWRPARTDIEASNATEAALLALIDDTLCISSVANIARLLDLLTSARTEPERALVLVILRATATSAKPKLAKTCISAYEKRGGLKIAKQWLDDAVAWNHTDLLVLLLEVLKALPLQLPSITDARINEPIVNLRKSAREEKVKRTAQELLKVWRTKFTEKAKASAADAPVKPTAASATASSSSAALDRSVALTTPATASGPKLAGDGPSPTKVPKPLKKRTIKRLERLPYGGGTAVSKSSSSSSSDLIGNLMQRKSAKDAAAAAKSKNDSLLQKLSAKELASSSKASESGAASKSSSPPSPVAGAEAKDEVLTMALPTIQSFNAAVSSSSSSASSKKIRWADEEGKELVKVKLIESWRDLILYDPSQNEESFRDAKLREHASERNAMKGHKGAEPIAVAHEWTAPALMKLPEALEKRRHAVATDEVAIQSARTRREMEYLVLDGEIPPTSPKEWERSSNDLQRGPPIAIPLTDVGAPADAVATGASAAAFSHEPPQQAFYDAETDEDRALREALGPLQKSTIALLLENEDILPQVYDEAQRNGNRIPDGRVVEILEQRRHQQQRYGHGAAYNSTSSSNSSGYGGHGSASTYPQQPPPFSDYSSSSRQAVHGGAPPGPPPHAFHQQQAPPVLGHVGPGKRKAPGAGGILSDGPPPKRLMKRGPGSLPCIYFPMPGGCKHGNACLYIHDYSAVPAASGAGASEYNNYHSAGRFGHGQYAGMRGGGGNGMRHMHSGR